MCCVYRNNSGAGINCRTGIPCDSDCVSKGHGKNSTVTDCSYRSNFNGKAASHECKTIGDLYTISNKVPGISMPKISFGMIRDLFPDALTIAVLAGIESLLSCVVSDGMIGSRHKPNMELVAQGAGNIVSALFGGIPATGAIARTAAM